MLGLSGGAGRHVGGDLVTCRSVFVSRQALMPRVLSLGVTLKRRGESLSLKIGLPPHHDALKTSECDEAALRKYDLCPLPSVSPTGVLGSVLRQWNRAGSRPGVPR